MANHRHEAEASPDEKKTTKITRGSVILRIVQEEQIVAGKAYPQHAFAYHHGGKRIRRRLADFADAKREAEMVEDVSNWWTGVGRGTGFFVELVLEVHR